ncbi:MAG: acyltransferase [Desulfobacteraceae bacterium]|nr:acyltransferase [Desulfobacteraceae bacterium]
MQERRYDIDWLRVLAMVTIFFFHCTRLFDTESWHLKNGEQSQVLFISVRGLVWPWVMELFFLLSGIGTWYAFKSRSAGSYIWERIKRLLIPLYTVGLFVLLPIQHYFELITNEGYRSSFRQFIPYYLDRISLPGISQAPHHLVPVPFAGHLWFLQYLFLISLVSLPLMLYLKSDQGRRFINKLAEWCSMSGGIFLFIIPLSLVLIIFRGMFDTSRNWADLFWYMIFFVIGYIMAADKRFTQGVMRHGWTCLALWVTGFCLMGLLVFKFGYDPYPGKESFSVQYLLFQILWSITSWSAVVFVLSLGAKFLNKNHKALNYGNEAVLAFYLFHQTIILCVGWFVIRWDMGITLKFLITAGISFPLIIILYELFVRRFDIVRFFFGMRPKSKPSSASESQPPSDPG